jgi:hypothetical protein
MGNVAFADDLLYEISASEQAPEDDEDLDEEEDPEDEGEGIKPKDMPHG